MFKTLIYNVYFENKAFEYITKTQKGMIDSSIAFFAEAVSHTISNPFMVIKSRLEIVTSNIETNMFKSIINIYKNEGIKGLWTGNLMTILREAPYATIQYPI